MRMELLKRTLIHLMYMHIYPYKGKSRRLTMHVIHYLFPELLQSQDSKLVKLEERLVKSGFTTAGC